MNETGRLQPVIHKNRENGRRYIDFVASSICYLCHDHSTRKDAICYLLQVMAFSWEPTWRICAEFFLLQQD